MLDIEGLNDRIALCRIEDRNDPEKVTCMLSEAKDSSLMLSGLNAGDWEEIIEQEGAYVPTFQ